MKMDTKKHSSSSSTQADEEDYIDIEVSTSKTPSPQAREFEFQSQILVSTAQADDKDISPSPADELFYKGNLLPLHLPRRLQMVRNILENSAPPTMATSTPMESTNVSPTESCRVSCELQTHEFDVFHWSTDLLSARNAEKYFHQQQQAPPKKCWSRRLTLIKQMLLAQKLKASKWYFKSLFSKSSFPASESPFPAGDEKQTGSKVKDLLNGNHNNARYFKFRKENPFDESVEDGSVGHRKSFSGAIKRHCSAKCMSGFSSLTSSSSTVSSCSTGSVTLQSDKSSGFYELNLVNNCNKYSSDSEIEKAIEGAIAHCKKSQEKQCFSEYNRSINRSLIQR